MDNALYSYMKKLGYLMKQLIHQGLKSNRPEDSKPLR